LLRLTALYRLAAWRSRAAKPFHLRLTGRPPSGILRQSGARDDRLWRGRPAAQARMWPHGVVVLLPAPGEHLSFAQRVKDLPIQESFAIPVLPWAAWLDVGRDHADFPEPGAEFVAMNSGPLSLRMYSGHPRSIISPDSSSPTSLLFQFRLGTLVRHSCVASSITFRKRSL